MVVVSLHFAIVLFLFKHGNVLCDVVVGRRVFLGNRVQISVRERLPICHFLKIYLKVSLVKKT